ncbi:hypothetical protein KKB18_03660, partial [bacterium]|nr:hypothetical protein [bacterium]
MLPSANISTGLNSIFNSIVSPLERSPQHQQHPTKQINPRLVDKVDISEEGRKLSETEKSKVLNPKKTEELTEEEKHEIE